MMYTDTSPFPDLGTVQIIDKKTGRVVADGIAHGDGLTASKIVLEEMKDLPEIQPFTGEFSAEFTITPTRRNKRALAKLARMARKPPLRIVWKGLPIWTRIRLFWAVFWAKKRHSPIALVSEDGKRCLMANDINDLL